MKAGMPVVLVNPSSPRRRRRRNARRARASARRRSNPRRRRRRARRRRRNPSTMYARRRNPAARTMGQALVSSLMGGFGGLLSYGIHFGASYAPGGNLVQSLILAGAGTVTAVGVSRYADERAGAGIMGGTIALFAGRVHAQMSLGDFAKKAKEGSTQNGTEAAGMRRLNPVASYTGPLAPAAGKVVPRAAAQPPGAGAMLGRGGGIAPTVAKSAAPMGFAGGQSFRVPMSPGAAQGRRLFGPRSWVYETGKVYRSAHDVPRG